MAEPSRGLQISRRGWLLAGLLAPLFPAKGADSLIVTFDGDNLHISSLGVHFLQGKSLNRLKEGATVEYVATVGLFRDPFVTQFKRSEHHFFVSYDVWGAGDVFAVSTPGPPARRATNLSLSATETWCLERLALGTVGIPKNEQFWLQLELRTVPPNCPPSWTAPAPRGRDRSADPRTGRAAGIPHVRSAASGRPGATRQRTVRVNRLRNRLILIFLAATLVPLAVTMWYTTSLLKLTSFRHAADQVDTLSQSLRRTSKELYQRDSADLKAHAQNWRYPAPKVRRCRPRLLAGSRAELRRKPGAERFDYDEQEGNRLDYLVRHDGDVWVYSTSLNDIAGLRARSPPPANWWTPPASAISGADPALLHPGGIVLWLLSLALLVYHGAPHQPAHPAAHPGSDGAFRGRLERPRGGAPRRRNRARHQGLQRHGRKLQESTERLVYLRQLASWQTLARKMAHEVKNSLTPIRLTVEEMMARYEEDDRGFMEQATQIVVDEIETLERRIRAFSQFAAEPPVRPGELDVNSLLQERVASSKRRIPKWPTSAAWPPDPFTTWWPTRISSRASSPTCWRMPPRPPAKAAASWA
jgi:two-component system, NtrC family, nitrogen regulation sensor histidine kinase NtrY